MQGRSRRKIVTLQNKNSGGGGGTVTGADNGLSLNGTTVEFGGDLIHQTILNQELFRLDYRNGDFSTSVQDSDNEYVYGYWQSVASFEDANPDFVGASLYAFSPLIGGGGISTIDSLLGSILTVGINGITGISYDKDGLVPLDPFDANYRSELDITPYDLSYFVFDEPSLGRGDLQISPISTRIGNRTISGDMSSYLESTSNSTINISTVQSIDPRNVTIALNNNDTLDQGLYFENVDLMEDKFLDMRRNKAYFNVQDFTAPSLFQLGKQNEALTSMRFNATSGINKFIEFYSIPAFELINKVVEDTGLGSFSQEIQSATSFQWSFDNSAPIAMMIDLLNPNYPGAIQSPTTYSFTSSDPVSYVVGIDSSYNLFNTGIIYSDVSDLLKNKNGITSVTFDGISTVYSIPHGLGADPTGVFYVANILDTFDPNTVNRRITATSTNIILTFFQPPLPATVDVAWAARIL